MTITQSATTVPAEPSDESPDFLASASSLVDEIGHDWDVEDELDAMCRYAVEPPGKLFRPYLLLEACSAVGGDLHAAVPPRWELSTDTWPEPGARRHHRRGLGPSREVVRSAAYGRDHAIVVGDSLIFRLFLALSECADRGASADRVVASLRAVALAGVDLCRGQTLRRAGCVRYQA